MKSRPTQFGARENTASSRRHASRLAVDSLPSKSKAIPRGSQHRQPTPVSTYRASESNMSIITMPLEAATGGETGDSAETFSAPTAVITAKESRQVLPTPEPFVSADEAAQYYNAIVITPEQTLAILKSLPLASSLHAGAHLRR